jgi:hypothetical protein
MRRVIPVLLTQVDNGQPMGVIADDLLEESRQSL